MFSLVVRPEAIRRLTAMKRFYARAIVEAIERHLRDEPEKISRTSIRRLRGHPEAVCRLRVSDYRVFYDVMDDSVEIVQLRHTSETPAFYKEHTP